MDQGTQAIVGVLGAVALLLAKRGLDMIPAPPFVGVILMDLAALLAWFALVQVGWFPLLARRYIHYPV